MNTMHSLTTLVIVMLLCLPSLAFAGDEELTSRQQELNQKGVEAINDGDFETAIDYLKESLELGERNITHANLGRAYQRAGDCERAAEHFALTAEAPAVERPTPEQIAEAIDGYRREIERECPGLLEVECDPTEIALFIDGEGPESCDGEAREMMPGTYELRGEYEEQITETTVAVAALQTSRVRLTLSSAHVAGPDDEEMVEIEAPPRPERSSGSAGWAFLAASGAAVAGGILLDTVPDRANNYEVNAINFVPVGLYAAGIGLGFMGIRGIRR